ncbi:MAG: flippase [Candidatus Altiarchaeota archaeon]
MNQQKNNRGSIRENTTYLAFSDVYQKLILFASVAIIARFSGPAVLGELLFSLSYVGLMLTLSDWGISHLLIRQAGKEKKQQQRITFHAIALRMVLAFVAVAFTYLGALGFGFYFKLEKTLFLLSIWLVFSAAIQIFCAVFRLYESMRWEAYVRATEKTSLVLLIIGGAYFSASTEIFSLAFATSAFIAATIAAVIVVPNLSPLEKNIRISELKGLFWIATPFGFAVFFSELYLRADTLILYLLKDPELVGFYNSAYYIVLAATFIPIAITQAMYPNLSRRFKSESRKVLSAMIRRLLSLLFISGIIGGLAIYVFSAPLIYLAFGKGFVASVAPLRILSTLLPAIFLTIPLGFTLYSIGRERFVAVSTGVCAILNISLNVALIPIYGMMGAALTTVITEYLLLASYLFVIKGEVDG